MNFSIEQIGILFTIVAGLCTAAIFLIKESKKKQINLRKRLNRNWTNEGDVTGFGSYTHFIDLDLSVDEEDGEIVGLAKSRPLRTEEDSEFNNISVNGKLIFNRATITFTDVKRGRIVVYGVGLLRLKGKHVYLTIRKRNGNFLPQKAILWSNSNWNFVRTK